MAKALFPCLPFVIGGAPSPASGFLSLPLFQRLASPPSTLGAQLRLMADINTNKGVSASVDKIRQFLNSNPSGGWERCWEEGLTPWDLGRPTPILEHLIQTKSIPDGRALVPGCGSGYDVVALASPERCAIGLDISEVAIKKARQIGMLTSIQIRNMSFCGFVIVCTLDGKTKRLILLLTSVFTSSEQLAASSPNGNYCSFLLEDFFTWEPRDLFDLIFDYTFFCAIEPNLRSTWASRMRDLLKPDGELITLIFPIDDHEGGPPYKTSVADYEKVLHPIGFQATSVADNELAVAPRRGREKLGRWRRMTGASAL
ncbi:hypothetical protein Cgig2_021812 [Carnegiea gigantea]|uniref:Thiol methyltransferase 2 n=1 Tax=Carnegiea gigantea TaxID=171969 RepID=A0A9Q1KAN3_9CARY|nr:hypothetical protein Cgig2_021812 [Carnegiea gigantea]